MAFQLGLEFSPDDPFDSLSYPFALFGRATAAVPRTSCGVWQEMPVREFDFWHYDESTDSDGNRSRTYYRFPAPSPISRCVLVYRRRRKLVHGARGSHRVVRHRVRVRDFNRAFNVKSKDRKFANRHARWADAVTARDGLGVPVRGMRQVDPRVRKEAPSGGS
jgi:hypothetical protein